MSVPGKPTRILVLGGGFGGVYTTVHLQRLLRRDANVRITLVDRDNFFLMTPLLFEAGSGVLEPRHTVTPIRTLLDKAHFVEADVERVDLDAKVAYARHEPSAKTYAIEYDHVVFSLGGTTNRKLIPGSEHALTFKTLADAIFLRNRIIDLFEQAEVEADPDRKRRLLTFIVIGAGLVGTELVGELTEFVDNLTRTYRNIRREEVKFFLLEAGPKLMPEMDRPLAAYAEKILRKRGVDIRVSTPARQIEPGRVHLPDGSTLEGYTIMLVAGVVPSPVLTDLPLDKDRKGRLVVDGTMRSKQRPEVWAVGDCASIPDPSGNPYPPLAQHALREARVLAANIVCAIRAPDKPLKPFVYETLGMLASLGHFRGVGRVLKLRIYGVPAWFVWRTYYLMQMPRWNRRFRIVVDWTIALFFRNDVAKLDLFGEPHPALPKESPSTQTL